MNPHTFELIWLILLTNQLSFIGLTQTQSDSTSQRPPTKLKQRMKLAAVLRAAKVEMWKQKRWNAPFYWATLEI